MNALSWPRDPQSDCFLTREEKRVTTEGAGGAKAEKPMRVGHACRAIVTIIDEPLIPETALLSQQALACDWDRPEEDVAWSHRPKT